MHAGYLLARIAWCSGQTTPLGIPTKTGHSEVSYEEHRRERCRLL